MQENKAYLKEQIITYLGNKRALLGFLEQGFDFAKTSLKKEKFSFCDVFSGSGVVARFTKAHANFILANDLEDYSRVINTCYLSNQNEPLLKELHALHEKLTTNLHLKEGFLSKLYAPKDDTNIKKGERVFFTRQNALYLDTLRAKISKIVPKNLQAFFIAPLIYETSVHSNTSGVFKGFYKGKDGVGKFGGEGENALKRIKGEIKLKLPVFSNFRCDFRVEQMDANALADTLDGVDVAYLDPPYNQHPYSSNYFMLNLLANYEKPSEISKVSGIVKGWNKSAFNNPKLAEDTLFEVMFKLRAKVILLSYNCEGFVKKESFLKRLKILGKCELLEQRYNTFRGSRNLKNRPIHINEQLYVLKKA